MSEEVTKPDSNIKSTIDAATGLVKAIPIYQDAVQPSAQQIGKSLETVTKTVNIALAPIKALVWGYEQIENFVTKRVAEKLRNVPEENITTPQPQLAGPAVEALRYTGHDENLRELFANLLATAMDSRTADNAHPGYVEIIKNITSDEALLLTIFLSREIYPKIDVKAKDKEANKGFTLMFTNFSHIQKIVSLRRPDLIPSYINNLSRLGILEIPDGVLMAAPGTYEPLENDTELEHLKIVITETLKSDVEFDRGIFRLTSFGKQFVDNVVKEKE